MSTKAQRTTAYIIETVAPIFNRQGFVGTSLSDLTEATGLTKGAIYGNFENKDEIALAAFKHNSNRLIAALQEIIARSETPKAVLFNLVEFYRNYDEFTRDMGGCPLVNAGVDAQYIHRGLARAVRETINLIENNIAAALEKGVSSKTIKLTVPPIVFAKQFFTLITGAVTMSTVMQDRKYLVNSMNYIEIQLSKEF
jgi:AcrR family transcriptional regulator